MSVAAREWLAAHAHDVPAVLQEQMQNAAVDVTATDVQTELVSAAVACLRVALQRCDDRAAALHLLAADALATHACALAADDVGALDAVAAALSPDRMSALITQQGV